MRIIIGRGINALKKSELMVDEKITIEKALMFEFPVPAKKVKATLVKGNGEPTLVLLFD